MIFDACTPMSWCVGVEKPSFLRCLGSSVLAGGTAGLCYITTVFPMDVIKNRMQAAKDVSPPVYSGVRDTARKIYADGGIKMFFRGFSPGALRAFPANAAAFSAFELVMYISRGSER